jgi:hypothetical protein
LPTIPISVIGASGTNTTKLPWFSLAITPTGMSWTTGPAVVTGMRFFIDKKGRESLKVQGRPSDTACTYLWVSGVPR